MSHRLRSRMPAILLVSASGGGSDAPPTRSCAQKSVAAVVVIPGAVGPLVSGGRAVLAVRVTDAHGQVLVARAVRWRSTDVTVATVSERGIVTAVDAGMTRIVAFAARAQGSASVTVELTSLTVRLGEARPLTATVRGSAGHVLLERAVHWASDQLAIATVSPLRGAQAPDQRS